MLNSNVAAIDAKKEKAGGQNRGQNRAQNELSLSIQFSLVSDA